MQIIVDELLTNYRSVGNGKLIILLHGWGDSLTGFSNLQTELAQKYHVVSLDLPGFGNTEAPHGTWGLDDYALFVAAFIAKLSLPKVYAIIGHSNGGAIAIRGLGKEYLKVDKLVLLASSGIRNDFTNRKKVLRLTAKAAKIATYPLPNRFKDKLKRQAYAAIGSDMFVAEHLQATFKNVVTDDLQADANKLKIPTLLIYGADDTATPLQYGETFKRCIEGSQLLVVAKAGHFIHLNQPVQVLSAIEEFLQ